MRKGRKHRNEHPFASLIYSFVGVNCRKHVSPCLSLMKCSMLKDSLNIKVNLKKLAG